MSALEHELGALAADVFPQTPDLAGAVRARLEAAPEQRVRWRGRRSLALALAVLAAVVGAAMAVPQARSTILRWFGIGSVRVELVERLPAVPVPPGELVGLGERVELPVARARAPFAVLLPTTDGLDSPDAVYIRRTPFLVVSLLYGTTTEARLLITEVPGRVNPALAKKLVGSATRIDFTSVFGNSAIWIEGAPHEFFFIRPNGLIVPGTLRLARNTLIAQTGGLTIRIEGQIEQEQAIRIARSLR
jgi:hypothetical protein